MEWNELNLSYVCYDMRLKCINNIMTDNKPVMVTFEISQILVIM